MQSCGACLCVPSSIATSTFRKPLGSCFLYCFLIGKIWWLRCHWSALLLVRYCVPGFKVYGLPLPVPWHLDLVVSLRRHRLIAQLSLLSEGYSFLLVLTDVALHFSHWSVLDWVVRFLNGILHNCVVCGDSRTTCCHLLGCGWGADVLAAAAMAFLLLQRSSPCSIPSAWAIGFALYFKQISHERWSWIHILHRINLVLSAPYCFVIRLDVSSFNSCLVSNAWSIDVVMSESLSNNWT